MKIIQNLPLILILMLGSGCHTTGPKQGEELGDLLDRLVVGSSTRKEVISLLGPPDHSSAGTISYFNFLYSEKKSGFVNLIGTHKPLIVKYHQPAQYINLLFEFDNHGRLTQFSQNPSPERDTVRECLYYCNEAAEGCFVSINEGEGASKGELRCEKEKQICFLHCETNSPLKTNTFKTDPIEHDDCDPGIESCD